MGFNFKNEVLSQDELIINQYKELYLSNQKAKAYDLKLIWNEIDDLSKNGKIPNSDKLTELSKIDVKVKRIINDEPTLSNYFKITREYLIKQKEKEFDKANPNNMKDPVKGILLGIMLERKREEYCKVEDNEVFSKTIENRRSLIGHLYWCIVRCGLHELIKNRSDDKQLFNLLINYIDEDGKKRNEVLVLLKMQELLEHYIEPYNLKHDIMVRGLKIKYDSIKIVRVSKGLLKSDEVGLLFEGKGVVFDEKKFQNRLKYFNECELITEDFINTKKSIMHSGGDDYVFPGRMSEMLSISNPSYDLKKLIQLCKELNIANKNATLYTKAALVRAICDHVPPIFNLKNFDEVASNYKSERNAQSFKGATKRLYDFFKHVADSAMHSQVRKKESLPTIEQLDFRRELDCLLQEVCRLLS